MKKKEKKQVIPPHNVQSPAMVHKINSAIQSFERDNTKHTLINHQRTNKKITTYRTKEKERQAERKKKMYSENVLGIPLYLIIKI